MPQWSCGSDSRDSQASLITPSSKRRRSSSGSASLSRSRSKSSDSDSGSRSSLPSVTASTKTWSKVTPSSSSSRLKLRVFRAACPELADASRDHPTTCETRDRTKYRPRPRQDSCDDSTLPARIQGSQALGGRLDWRLFCCVRRYLDTVAFIVFIYGGLTMGASVGAEW